MGRATELRLLDDEELAGRLVEQRKELFNLRFQLATGRLDSVTRITEVRRQIARVLTVQRDRELATGAGSNDQGRGDR